MYELAEKALRSCPPPDGGDKFDRDTNVRSWPIGTKEDGYYVYEWISMDSHYSMRMVVPQSCSDQQVRNIVRAWVVDTGISVKESPQPVTTDYATWKANR